jgi:hypothetical protein
MENAMINKINTVFDDEGLAFCIEGTKGCAVVMGEPMMLWRALNDSFIEYEVSRKKDAGLCLLFTRWAMRHKTYRGSVVLEAKHFNKHTGKLRSKAMRRVTKLLDKI